MTTHLNARGYRRNVGIALFNRQGLVFVGERIDVRGAWQMPQGGMDDSEDDLIAAAMRELREEVGTDNARVLGISEQLHRYEFPGPAKGRIDRYRGQEQRWVALRFLGSDSEIRLDADAHQEFVAWRWVPLEETPRLIAPFKRAIYQAIAAEFARYAVPEESPPGGG